MGAGTCALTWPASISIGLRGAFVISPAPRTSGRSLVNRTSAAAGVGDTPSALTLPAPCAYRRGVLLRRTLTSARPSGLYEIVTL
jgi:hypothetical protein